MNYYVLTDRIRSCTRYKVYVEDLQVMYETTTEYYSLPEPIFLDIVDTSKYYRLYMSDGSLLLEEVSTVQNDIIELYDAVQDKNFILASRDGTLALVLGSVVTGYGSNVVVGVNSYVTPAEAEAYLGLRFGADEFWTNTINKPAALVTAYRLIAESGYFDNLPTTSNTSMKNAQCEMALFLAMEGGDILRRKGLQAQGVLSAGIVKEVYDKNIRDQISFPPEVLRLLNDYCTKRGNAHVFEIDRDDDEDVI